MTARPLARPAEVLRGRLIGRVRAVFNDQARGELPVRRSDNALFPRDSVIRNVHADIISMMVGGTSALLLQMLHPAALAGVLDHSNFREDMLGRLRRTARFIAVTTFGERDEAEAAIERVRDIHDQVRGTLADGTTYEASDPWLLAWVHVAEAISFLNAWIAYAEPEMTAEDQDFYFAQFAVIARKLGVDPVPESRASALALIEDMRPDLRGSDESKEIARLILAQRGPGRGTAIVQRMIAHAAVDLLPPWARTMLGLKSWRPSAGLVRGTTFGMAATLRWAFASGPAKPAGS